MGARRHNAGQGLHQSGSHRGLLRPQRGPPVKPQPADSRQIKHATGHHTLLPLRQDGPIHELSIVQDKLCRGPLGGHLGTRALAQELDEAVQEGITAPRPLGE